MRNPKLHILVATMQCLKHHDVIGRQSIFVGQGYYITIDQNKLFVVFRFSRSFLTTIEGCKGIEHAHTNQYADAQLVITIEILYIPIQHEANNNITRQPRDILGCSWLKSEPLIAHCHHCTVAGYNAMTELGRISSFIRRVTDDSVAAKLEEEEEDYTTFAKTVNF